MASRESEFLRRLAYLGAAHGPRWFLRYSPPLIGLTAAALSTEARHAVLRNLRRVRGDASFARDTLDTMRTFAAYAGSFAEALATGSKNDEPLRATAENAHYFKEQLGGPIIIGTLHSGGWDVLGTLLSEEFEVDLAVVMTKEPDAGARRIQDAVRAKGNVRVIHVGADELAALPVLRHLRGGGVAAMQLDRTPPGMRTVKARLFDRAASMPEGPFRLAQLTGAPIVPIFCARHGFRRYLIRVHPPIRLARRATDDDIGAAAQTIADAMTAFVREHPTQWFNFAPDERP